MKTPLYYDKMYLGDTELSAVYWGKDKIWKVPYPTTQIRRPMMVYAPKTRDFTANGICVIRPSSAVHELSYNQAGEITVEHPIDREGKWKQLTPNKIILAPMKWHGEEKPQAFRIYRIVKQMDESGRKTLTVYARHVFYDLTYSVIKKEYISGRPRQTIESVIKKQIGYDGTPTFNALASDAWYSRDGGVTTRNFDSEIGGNSKFFTFQDTSISAALIGDGESVASVFGLELYVDNFYFSMYTHANNVYYGHAMDNSFDIRYSHDMQSVSEDIDYTDAFTYLATSDNFGDTSNAAYTSETVYGPYARPKSLVFSYSDSAGTAQDNLERLVADQNLYWDGNNAPTVSYTAKYAPLNRDKTRDFIGQLDGREVGDTGTVTNAELGISTLQRIIYKKTDLLTDSVLEIRLGNPPAYLTKKSGWSDSARTASPSAIEKQVEALRNA